VSGQVDGAPVDGGLEWLREWRMRVLLTQEELAARTGMAARTVRDIETGRTRQPRPTTIRLLINALKSAEADLVVPDDVATPGQGLPTLLESRSPRPRTDGSAASETQPSLPRLAQDDVDVATAGLEGSEVAEPGCGPGTLVTSVQLAPLATKTTWMCQIPCPGSRAKRFLGVVTGDIRRVTEAEVWVNPENTAMEMARFDDFSVSSIIRYEGARRDTAGVVTDDYVADELSRHMAGRRHIQPGTVIITGAGELRRFGVRFIAHVAVVQGEPGGGYRQIREIGRCTTNALAAVTRLVEPSPITTILIPLIGTGQGHGNIYSTANALLGAVIDYFAVNPDTHLTTVYGLAYTHAELTAWTSACTTANLELIQDSQPQGGTG
jgi:transcriptional regulator with XRE-family HTH domain/O-acetyl-ADP-ribose deacetylase (regulator of RNase III)